MDLKDEIASLLWGQHVGQMINSRDSNVLADKLITIMDKHTAEDTAWFVEQINHYRQRCEELEIEVEIERNSFGNLKEFVNREELL